MIRILLVRALLFAVPFAIYGAYLLLARARSIVPAHATPWTWLFVAGLSLVAISFVYLGLTEGESTQGLYVPPHTVNGKVVRGHIEKAHSP